MVRWESELIPILADDDARKLLRGGEGTASEVASGYGVADLVFFNFDKKIIEERVKRKLSPIEQTNLLRILLELQRYGNNESINITTLLKKAPFTKEDVITYLIENKFLVSDPLNPDGKIFKKGVGYENGLQDVVAIEAKLKDWKRGLYQAYRYRSYADKSYLAVYTRAIKSPLQHIDEFKKYNVGLIEVRDDSIKVHYRPKKERHADPFTKAVAYESLLSQQKDLFPGFKEIPRSITV